MRFFQEREYISLDYARRDALRVGVKKPGPEPEFGFEKLAAPATEPLQGGIGSVCVRSAYTNRAENGWGCRKSCLGTGKPGNDKHP